MTAVSDAEESPTPPKRVLVVEDEPHIRELVGLHLRLEGLEVVEASAGDEAIRSAES
jgi:DNA-binding response OmpR family regulator